VERNSYPDFYDYGIHRTQCKEVQDKARIGRNGRKGEGEKGRMGDMGDMEKTKEI